ncbi:unnamed protein product, partial [Rotaria socialis]
ECTAVDAHKANVVLNTMLTMFAQYCSKPFEIEPVEVEQVDGKVIVYPVREFFVFAFLFIL